MRLSLYQALGMQPWTSAVCPSQLSGDFLQEDPDSRDWAEGLPVCSCSPSPFPITAWMVLR